jgi:hypothetical protein
MRNLPGIRIRLHFVCGVGAGMSYVGWLWLSYRVTHHPGLLAQPVGDGWFPVRHDSLAAACGIGSALLFWTSLWLWPAKLSIVQRGIRAAAWTGVLYGASGWYYISQNRIYHPQTLHWPLTHFLSFPQEQTFGSVCAVVTVMSFIALIATILADRYRRE